LIITKDPLTHKEKKSNINIILNAVKALGTNVDRIDINKILSHFPRTISQFIWLVVETCVYLRINLKNYPQLFTLIKLGEDVESFAKLSTKKLLLRWFNYHLSKSKRTVNNFTDDLEV